MSFGDEHLEPHLPAGGPEPHVLSAQERSLLAQSQWSVDELIRMAFLARRLAERVDRMLLRAATGGSAQPERATE